MSDRLQLVPLTPEHLDRFAAFLGDDAFGGCFCAVWTHFGADWGERCRDPERPNLAATRIDVEAGRSPGFLVEHDGELVAWTGSGPKPEFPLLRERLGARRSEEWSATTWCIGCLAIAGARRGQGLAAEIVRAVIARAGETGATRIEAYPTDPWDEPRSYRGALPLYRRLGFEEEARESDGTAEIVLMARSVGPSDSR